MVPSRDAQASRPHQNGGVASSSASGLHAHAFAVSLVPAYAHTCTEGMHVCRRTRMLAGHRLLQAPHESKDAFTVD